MKWITEVIEEQRTKRQKEFIENFQLKNMENNLKFFKRLTFDELVQHGLENGANVVNGMPWSWQINGKAVTHESNHEYLIETNNGFESFRRNNVLIALENGLHILTKSHYDTHAPVGCQM